MTNPQYMPPGQGGPAPKTGGIMQTAQFGMYGLIATAIGFLLNLIGLPFGGLLSLAGLVLAIVSLVKKETPKWPAWVTIGLALAGVLLVILLLIAGAALIGVATMGG